MVKNIQVNGNYNIGISESPKLRFINNEWKLISERLDANQSVVTIIQEHNNEASKFIIKRILEFKEAEPIPTWHCVNPAFNLYSFKLFGTISFRLFHIR